MTISYPLNIDSTLEKWSELTWYEVNGTSLSVSPFTGAGFVYAHDLQLWRVQVNFSPLDREEFAKWSAFLSSLRGHVGTFKLGSEKQKAAQGAVSGSPVTSGTSSAGAGTVVIGSLANSTLVFKAGDLIQINNALYKVLSDTTSDGSGAATADIWPKSRGHATSQAVVYDNPKGLFRLMEGTISWRERGDSLYDLSFIAEEVV